MTRVAILTLLACLAAPSQSFDDLKIDRVAGHCLYADGPVWAPDGHLIFSDVPAGNILKWVPGLPAVVMRESPNGAAGNTLDQQGRLYTCETHARRVVRTDKKGKVEVLAEKWQGKRFNAPNDIVVRKDGEVYFTDPAFGNQQDSRDLDFHGVYHLPRKGELEVVAKPHGRPNGIAISPNGKILYVGNSDERSLTAYDLDKNGAASNERVLIPHIDGIPNGIKVDEKGNLYIAAKHILVFSSDGKPLGQILMPETPSNCAFGDADFQSLYITARTSVYRVRLDVKGSVQYEHER